MTPPPLTPAPGTDPGARTASPSLWERTTERARLITPGIALSAAAAAVAFAVNQVVPTVSALLIAILIGILLRNATPLPAAVEPGLQVSAKRLLRCGVVLLGLQLVVSDILALGVGMIGVVVAVVVVTLVATLFIGRLLGMTWTQTLLIGCGFSICGAAAVAAVDAVVETEDEEEVVTAIALVVLFGTLAIPLLPLAAHGLGLDPLQTGLWAGASVHEVAQVVAIGGAISSVALSGAVVVKLARVLMLAPLMTVISMWKRRMGSGSTGRKPPIMPLFVAGFIAMVALRWTGLLPAQLLAVAKVVQTGLLAAAMFALGTGVRISMFRRVGVRPFLLALASTGIISIIGLGGVLLTHAA